MNKLEYKREYSKNHYLKNKEKYKRIRHEYYLAHKDEYRARDKRWKKLNKEKYEKYIKKYRETHKKEHCEYKKEYHKENRNKELCRERTRNYYGKLPKGYQYHHYNYNNPHKFKILPISKHTELRKIGDKYSN